MGLPIKVERATILKLLPLFKNQLDTKLAYKKKTFIDIGDQTNGNGFFIKTYYQTEAQNKDDEKTIKKQIKW